MWNKPFIYLEEMIKNFIRYKKREIFNFSNKDLNNYNKNKLKIFFYFILIN